MPKWDATSKINILNLLNIPTQENVRKSSVYAKMDYLAGTERAILYYFLFYDWCKIGYKHKDVHHTNYAFSMQLCKTQTLKNTLACQMLSYTEFIINTTTQNY